MLEQEIEIINKLGLHARAAAKLVNTASAYACDTRIVHAGESADAKSIMAVMMLAASKGSMVTIRCSGTDEQAAMDALSSLINNFFGEGE